ncbi:phage terminase small subunit [Paenibacillus dendritiformis]|uniref:phage terminase small subunit n=1 Tax=Paenibacillus dendritiformis TaxID=130049 RepID=UPI00364CE6B9
MAEMHKMAEQDYMGGMKYKDIAEKYGVSLNTVKSWKQRHGWTREKGAPSNKGVHTKRGGAPKGNRNAVGNRGGAAPRGNSNAVKHGFYRKHFPEEALEIMEELAERSPLDVLWDNIVIQYTAIIRAQRIMFVVDRDDKTIERIEEKSGEKSWGEKWEVQQAWDKQATFLQAQSRAMSTLQSLIRQYDELLKTELATEEQKARIEVLRSKVPNKDGIDPNAQITALADLINNPAPDRVIDDD